MTEIVPKAEEYYHVCPRRFRFEASNMRHMHIGSHVEAQHFEQFYKIATRLVPNHPVCIRY